MLEKSVHLGPEWDNDLRRRFEVALRELGAVLTEHSWGIGGSQEVETLDIVIGGRQLHVEAETYMGLTLSGPADLVERIAEMVSSADDISEQ